MTSSKNVVAKMTIRKNNKLTAKVEIHSNAGHGDFYHWYVKSGRTWSEVRTSNRNDGQNWTHLPNGLEVLTKRFTRGEQIKIKIGKKRLYKKFLSCRIDQLPGYRPVVVNRADLNKRARSTALDILTLLRSEIQS